MASLTETSCVFAADGDLLGLGVRIGAYLAVGRARALFRRKQRANRPQCCRWLDSGRAAQAHCHSFVVHLPTNAGSACHPCPAATSAVLWRGA